MNVRKFSILACLLSLFLSATQIFAAAAEEELVQKTFDEKIDQGFGAATKHFVQGVFYEFPMGADGYGVKWIILWLGIAGVICTLAFKFVNFSAFGLAIRTIKGKYSSSNDPGDISHFAALSTAVSGTVGLGNIAGVAAGISVAGPGVAFWLFLSGFLGMATKFAECTLGVKYREFDSDGKVHGGAMYYLKKGLAERGLGPVGTILAIFFAIFCIFASFGGGNIFQINQTVAQLINVTGGEEASFFAENQWVFGAIMAVLTGVVIIGGVTSIARVTSKLVPAMCVTYIVCATIVLIVNFGEIPRAISMIVSEAFEPRAAVTGGFLAAFIWGIRRATFSNEAGIGSAPIAHSAVKTRQPASEGLVALLEPFIDTVIVCSMTSLVIVTSMQFDGDSTNFMVGEKAFALTSDNNSTSFGIGLTSAAFEAVNSNFKYLLFVCVSLFAFSTLITWSYYGLQAWQYLFGRNKIVALLYKVIFCLVIVVGATASMGNAVDFSDASLFAMSIPNLIGVYLMIPLVKKEYSKYRRYTELVDGGKTLEEANAEVSRES